MMQRVRSMMVMTALLLLGCGARAVEAEPHAQGEDEHAHGEGGEHGEHEEEGHGHDELPSRVALSEQVIAEAQIQSEPVQRQVVAPVLFATGHVEADPGRTAQVPAKVGGIVEEVLFREGDVVKAGQVLATVRAPSLGSLRADLASLQARTTSARANLTRLEALAERSMASQQELAAARAEAAALEAESQAAKQRLQALGLGAKGKATVFSLRAPIAGFVTQRNVVPGQPVTPEQTLATIVDLERAWFVARLFEHLLAKIRVGAAVEVELNAYPDHPFHGKIEYLAPTVDAEAQTVVARIPIDNREGILRVGLFGKARIAVTDPRAEPTPVLAVPRDAIIEVAGKTVVFVRGEDGAFELHEVVLGTAAPGVVEILQGLREGEPVVTRGAWTLKSVLLKGTFGEDHGH
ncbi:efflux RND transporter periplasmic adaptor subunit [Nannocystis bainbridge]|uniref:Efflux RND transporter periplasmic adaptor subunit n=1 Tax=Nannocystis bainbridge TaxID=2995303 RepID=A0ABT5E5G0_9BACT|nr:efflux RND transporter periplasmic adaptor subunit [Nannocystis bainbridge]MDC0720635.1 efflux RND transporter periplasmic adaptor subunit [Nannocystis bainbridge]